MTTSFELNGGAVEHALNGSSTTSVFTGGGVIQDGNWYYLVATYDTSDGNVEIYINGVDQNVGGHGAVSNNINLGTGGEIGAWNLGRDFQGNIDEVAMYASVLTPGEVLTHYEAAFQEAPVVPEPSTLVIWALGLLGLAAYARRRR